jgi:hypothetical protein
LIGGVALFAIVLLASCSETGSNEPSIDTGSASTGVHILDDCPELPCQGPLEPGEYRWEYGSTATEPTIAFTVREPGWTWLYGGGSLHIVADDTPHEGLYSSDGIYLLRDPSIASQDCEEAPEPGVGRSVGDLVAWLQAAPGLAVSEATELKVGGLEGVQLDLELAPTWQRTCFFSRPLPTVPLVMREADAQGLGGYHWAMLPRMSMRWFLLPWKGGVIVVDIDNSKGGMSRDDLISAATPIVESFAFSAA